jgi:hypothetical protein
MMVRFGDERRVAVAGKTTTMNDLYEDDWEEENEEFDSGEEEDDTVPCPNCRREIYEEAERCPYCGNYITAEEPGSSVKPWWFVVGFLLCMAIVLMWIAQG